MTAAARDLFGRNYVIEFTDDELETVMRPIAEGTWGGHQNLHAKVQADLAGGRVLEMEDSEILRAFKYGWGYGDGTWQNYSRAIVSAAVRAGWEPPLRFGSDEKLFQASVRYEKDGRSWRPSRAKAGA